MNSVSHIKNGLAYFSPARNVSDEEAKSDFKIIGVKNSAVNNKKNQLHIKRIIATLKKDRTADFDKKKQKIDNLINKVALSSIENHQLASILHKIADKNPKNVASILNKIADKNPKDVASILNKIADKNPKSAERILTSIAKIDFGLANYCVNKLNLTSDPLKSDKENIWILSGDTRIGGVSCMFTLDPLVSTDPDEPAIENPVFIKNSCHVLNNHVCEREELGYYLKSKSAHPVTKNKINREDIKNLFIIKVEKDVYLNFQATEVTKTLIEKDLDKLFDNINLNKCKDATYHEYISDKIIDIKQKLNELNVNSVINSASDLSDEVDRLEATNKAMLKNLEAGSATANVDNVATLLGVELTEFKKTLIEKDLYNLSEKLVYNYKDATDHEYIDDQLINIKQKLNELNVNSASDLSDEVDRLEATNKAMLKNLEAGLF
jgi:uncharacterized protein YfkK (UPF0435 family)